ncbi:BTB/POZ and TAZ domain-containing protein 2 [Datura stramonium]|uniref:glucose-1-phosphate adenylyltransferase n=1 Tax=Datura stramonium TaxID=4076 RepID=A0ABS8UM85_DATST|nr:BTB/POZ and TAZ domain-containing protein 2 [Datura stramonium]
MAASIVVKSAFSPQVTYPQMFSQFNSASLNRHLSRAYASNMGGYKNEGFVEVLAATKSEEPQISFRGTADAVRRYLWLFEEHNVLNTLYLLEIMADGCQFIQPTETDAVFRAALWAACHCIRSHRSVKGALLVAEKQRKQLQAMKNCKIHHSVVGLRSCISEGAIIEDTLLMKADYYAGNLQQFLGYQKRSFLHYIWRQHSEHEFLMMSAVCQIINRDNVQEAAKETNGYFMKLIVTVIRMAFGESSSEKGRRER